jgi:ATP-dependent RNA helicase DHX29
MAKKKKLAANPARGFATTSIASKPKPEQSLATKEEASLPDNEPVVAVEATAQATSNSQTSRGQVEQTPEELEAQLERDELQLLVEKHASKVRRDAHRQILKFQTDRRVLRSQSENMTVHDWLPQEVMDSIISLAQAESNDSNRRQGQQSLLKIFSEEELVAKLWMLQLSLRDMGFTSEHIEPVLRWLCANAAGIDNSAGVWGLSEALEWLALDNCGDHSLSYVTPKDKSRSGVLANTTPISGNSRGLSFD